jgi:hypothetical protein
MSRKNGNQYLFFFSIFIRLNENLKIEKNFFLFLATHAHADD